MRTRLRCTKRASILPSPKYPPLTPEQKQANKSLSQERLLVEHVIGWLKRFRLLCGPYRNRRKRLGLRFNLIAALYNAHLDV